jgi:thiamine kinase-like enzyme
MNLQKNQIIKICEKINVSFESFKLLGLGAHNINYLLITKQGKFVLRIENNLQFKNLKKEYTYLKKTKGKLGPKVYLFDNSKKIIPKDYLIEEFIVGKHPDNQISNDILKKIGIWFKNLHKNKSKNHNFLDKNLKFDLEKYFNFKYYNSYKKYYSILNLKTQTRIKKLNNEIDMLIKLKKSSFSNIKNLPLNHSDPSPTNCFIEKNGNLRFIDWEFIKYDLAELDLIFFIWSYQLSDKQKKLFLENYGYSTSRHIKSRYKLIEIIMYFSFLIWLFERLKLSAEGELKPKKGIYCSSKKEIIDKINNYLKTIEKLIENYNLDN